MPEGKRNETLETHIGIVGTEAKINQEELVKSRRKIWSLPLVLVTALLLVGLLRGLRAGARSKFCRSDV